MLKSLSDILAQQGFLEKNQYEAYKAQADQAGFSLLPYLVTENILTEKQVAEIYAAQFDLPLIEKITEQMADPDLLSKIPFKFLREKRLIPIRDQGTVFVVAANPTQVEVVDEVRHLIEQKASLAVAPAPVIADAVNRFYPVAVEETRQMIADLSEEEPGETVDLSDLEDKDIMTMAQEAPIIKLVNHILFQAVKVDASDIHIEPSEKEVRVRFRIDGVLHQTFTPPKRIQSALVSRIKIMANLNIAEKRLPQDGRINVTVAGKQFDIRVAVLPTTFGEKIVMRLLDKTKTFNQLANLGLTPRDLTVVMNAITQPNGILFMSGPTGSGKTSTLYSIIGKLNTPEVSIVTVEDPVEYQTAGVAQVQVNEKVGLTFARALRAILRQDPNIIMIGETRDQETAQIAIQASLTGHLVLSTIHTNSAPATITRLIDMGIEPFLIASSVTCVVAQRLVRKLHSCKKTTQPPEQAILQRLGINQDEIKKISFYRPVGCDECAQTGYKGRLPIFEVMEVTNAIAKLIIEKADAHVIRNQAIKDGMKTLLQDGLRKIEEGETTVEEVLAVASTQE